ncbi:3-dehydroquinate synthase [Sphingomicrobium nitratireducens]|uniref:3-dehydroquinate synthase n=1 Tax=Sphingomicrobium nitratireducens TaxID=2964666 RepID=UPI00223F427D|nr:3-dehydroquinate synthase [Sphingomicrobium nitratireducens]
MSKTPIFVGALRDHAERLEELADGAPLPVITDAHIWRLHGKALEDLLPVDPIIVTRGEAAKSWTELETLLHALTARNHPRQRPVVAFGGGSVGDLAGLAASLYRRGCPVIQLPTTLLAQVDSAVGGKTAIDFAGRKNMVGTFHDPALVIADPVYLTTLDPRAFRAGIAEIVKYGVIGDAEFFAALERGMEALASANLDTCADAIRYCLAAKQYTVADDPRDQTGRRALLNFGHSFGHAIEAVAGLGELNHGEAVAVGMMLAARYSAAVGHCDPAIVERLGQLLARADLPLRLSEVGLAGKGERLLDPMRGDKKNRDDRVTLILLRAIGDAFVSPDVEPDRLAAFLRDAG